MKSIRSGVLGLGVVLLVPAVPLADDWGSRRFSARLEPTQEVPALMSAARGHFSAVIDHDETTITYELAYDGLEGSVTQSHIHIAQRGVNGGVMVFLCGTAASPGPAGTPVCPPSGVVSGVLTSGQVIGPGGQGITAGEFEKVVGAMREGVAYANVHSTKWTGGEIRGQLQPGNQQ